MAATIHNPPMLSAWSDVVDLYFADIRHIPLLDAEAEQTLLHTVAQSIQAAQLLAEQTLAPAQHTAALDAVQNGAAARAQLIQANVRLVVSIAKSYTRRGVALADLIQEGNIGLMRAIDKFDMQKGTRLSTYASWWIREAINRALESSGRIRQPTHVHSKLRTLQRTRQQLHAELGRAPKDAEMRAALGITPQIYGNLLQAERTAGVQSLDQPVAADRATPLGAMLCDDAATVEDQVADRLVRADVQQLLTTLSARDRTVLALRYGLVDGHCHTLDAIGQQFGLTRERVRVVVAQALERARASSHAQRLRG